jgi:RHS repeat-associated protein
MPVTSYISVGGRMISEITDGVILDYVPDALGSIHSVIDQDANIVKTMRYKPYGEVLSRSGTVADRHYQWVGSYGYRATFAPSSSHYVRARHYSATAGSWTTVDPLWPQESAYAYVGGRSTAGIDPSGHRPLRYPDGRNYGCTSYPCCYHNTGYWADQCKKTGNKFTCCAASVSTFICLSVTDFEDACTVRTILFEGSTGMLGIKGSFKDYCDMSVIDPCSAADAFDCQNSCMRWGHEVKRDPLWKRARAICAQNGETSYECCEASFRAEQKEYETCAVGCAPPLNVLPYEGRLNFGLNMLKCCGKKPR